MTRQEVLHEAAWCLQMMLVQGLTWTEIECLTGIPHLTLKNIRAEKKNLSVDVISRMLEASGKTLIVVDKEDTHGQVQRKGSRRCRSGDGSIGNDKG